MAVHPARDLTALVLAVWLFAVVPAARAEERPEETSLAVPALSLTFSSTFLAEELVTLLVLAIDPALERLLARDVGV